LPRKAALLGSRRNSPSFRVSKHGQRGVVAVKILKMCEQVLAETL
jgi:hypothetical protein